MFATCTPTTASDVYRTASGPNPGQSGLCPDCHQFIRIERGTSLGGITYLPPHPGRAPIIPA